MEIIIDIFEDIKQLDNNIDIDTLTINLKIFNFKLFENYRNKIKLLNCEDNHLISFEGLNFDIRELNCSDNNITSFKELKVPINHIYCSENNITSFKGLKF